MFLESDFLLHYVKNTENRCCTYKCAKPAFLFQAHGRVPNYFTATLTTASGLPPAPVQNSWASVATTNFHPDLKFSWAISGTSFPFVSIT